MEMANKSETFNGFLRDTGQDLKLFFYIIVH